jgi:hypothetical protein
MRIVIALAVLGILGAFAPTDADAHGRRSLRRHVHKNHVKRFGGLRVGPCTEGTFDTDGDGTLSDDEITAARDARKARILAEHDGDGDGELSDEERAAARAAHQAAHEARHAERVAEYDTNEDGELSDEERAAAKAARTAARLEEFDGDGDGELSDEEAAAARAARCAAKDMDEEEDEGEELVLALALSLDFLRGDADQNETINIGDPISVLNFLFLGGPSSTCLDAADANDDGVLDLADPTTTLSSLFLGTGPLPAPVESPGYDPTVDGLTCDGLVSSGL